MRAVSAVFLLLVFAVSACAAPSAAPPPAESARAAIVEELQASAEAWNRGDLEGFLAPYPDAGDVTYVGSAGLVRGKDAIREVYRQGYWKQGAPEQQLGFEIVEFRPLDADHALLLGRYLLRSDDGQLAATGPFSLVYARTAQGWRIIHDHSS